jgi:tetratricopeptide (TPR) repeat protein
VFATSLNYMAQRNSRASIGGDEDIPSFPSPLAPDKGATALDLVYQAADVFRGMEKHARETEARAQSLCTSAVERLRLAEMRAEAAERAQRELTLTAERNLQHACRALEQAQSCIEAQQDKLTAVVLRAEVAEAEARKAKEALALVEEAIRKRLLCPNPDADGRLATVA